jgi:hypothetical protein
LAQIFSIYTYLRYNSETLLRIQRSYSLTKNQKEGPHWEQYEEADRKSKLYTGPTPYQLKTGTCFRLTGYFRDNAKRCNEFITD